MVSASDTYFIRLHHAGWSIGSVTTTQATWIVSGANGEIGHGLVSRLAELSPARIIALDLHAPDAAIQARCHRVVTGDIADVALLDTLAATYDFDAVYHLAALLSTKSERQPRLANRVNVDGTLNLLEMTVSQVRHRLERAGIRRP